MKKLLNKVQLVSGLGRKYCPSMLDGLCSSTEQTSSQAVMIVDTGFTRLLKLRSILKCSAPEFSDIFSKTFRMIIFGTDMEAVELTKT